ncbi:hypothetical protein Sjap_003857 [Stephania japonica]|uniref:Coiled-coil domain-containing protein 22 homolog n=1 Tax=Stephania japonica TaxID=461633 RepID=A0AAP0KRN3_9MAGN
MEEAQAILLNSLQSSGVSIPSNLNSIRELSPGDLVTICSQSLHLIDGSISIRASLPESVAERFKTCSEICSAIQSLGFIGELSFHQFLYPSEEDSYKLLRFLLERLSVTSEDEKAMGDEVKGKVLVGDHTKIDAYDVNSRLKLLKLETEIAGSDFPFTYVSKLHDEVASRTKLESSEHSLSTGKDAEGAISESVDLGSNTLGNDECVTPEIDGNVTEFQQKLVSLQEQSSEVGMIRNAIEDIKSQKELLKQQLAEKTLEVVHLENMNELLQTVVEMASDDQRPIDCRVEEINRQVEMKMVIILELGSRLQRVSVLPMEEKKGFLEELVNIKKPRVQDVELEIKAIHSEIQKRDEEHSKLVAELQKQPKVASRKSYIERIREITKNSRKQDVDIERILRDTRELLIDSNSIHERLHRTYAVVDETVFREAKNDPVRRQAYRVLTSIHETFEQISDKVLATDRVRRDVTELESKLTTMSSRSLNIDKLEADLESIRKENQLLEDKLQRHPS